MMKKTVLICFIVLALALAFSGCGKKTPAVNGDEKLGRIEISQADGQGKTTVLKNLSQSDMSDFFDEDNWKDLTAVPDGELTPEYRIALYQEKTETVIKTDDGDGYLKVMEYVTYKDSDIVKVIVGGEVAEKILPEELSDKLLDMYSIASEKFFSSLDKALEA